MTPFDYSLVLANMYLVANTLQFALLLTLEALDFITGLSVAIKNRKLNSTVSFVGISRKVITISIVIIFGAIFKQANLDYLTVALLLFYLWPQMLSLVENLKNLGVPFPQAIVQYFDKSKID